jgi:hypothetical protein
MAVTLSLLSNTLPMATRLARVTITLTSTSLCPTTLRVSVGSASLRVTKGKLMYKIVWLCNGVEMTSYVRASEALAFTANKQIISWQPHTYRR